MAKSRWLKKYTKLKYLPEILRQRHLHLGLPKEWDDRNDSVCVRLFASNCGGMEIRATCLTEAVDQFHFWHVFGERENGVCLWFNKAHLISDIENDSSLMAAAVEYRTIGEIEGIEPQTLPFLKRNQYRDEREFRILRVRAVHRTDESKFAFSPFSLERVYLNPWLSESEVKTEKSKISKLLVNELGHVRVFQNRMLEYRRWISAISRFSNMHR